ncbi:methionine ABC transporter ATP-binding protein [Pseudogracilibacillus auburnensis]|uniref:D-methionine transport system ATP-binding protein n=1 Tax=Pseudogracilibacillus auburnensis TaxID=1494959 RepID=A0A2V3VRG0_9BACI|nr:ATP-binding cassette domain-containing protein [Pseudogracilibacillus auburnensis]PXW82615.1 D-methionine transport system ATP-binding protein [Pseudogracilibacillus auburnensis]
MIQLEHVSKTYKRNGTETIALNNVSLQINKGDIFGVIGFSGAGKSTLIRMVNYLEKPTSGTVLIDGNDVSDYTMQELRKTRKNIGMIFQHFNLLNSKTIFHNVAIPLILAKTDKKVIKERVMELLQFVGLEEKATNYPNELSGGQKQRIGIARALASNPSILLCDEATSALDPQTTDSILQLLQKINQAYNITIMIITHEMSIIQKICNRVAVMEKGEIIEEGNVLEVFGNPKHSSTKNFVRTVLQDEIPENIRKKINVIPGSRLFKIDFNDESNELINDMIRNFGVTVNLIYATMNEIKTNTIGHMVIQLIGASATVNQAVSFLSTKEIYVKELAY